MQALAKLREKKPLGDQQSVDSNTYLIHRGPTSPGSGNPAGDVTTVEFFDY